MARATNSTIARALLADIDAGKDMQTITESLAAYLVQERRLGDLNAILRDVERQLFTQRGVLYVHADVARPMSEQQKQDVTSIFQAQSGAKEVVIEETINKGVIGGVRLTTADQQLDLTVRRQLQRLKSVG
ncbi:hypothetical protein EKI60_02470 [Candidatus Saccharibacteria bacterium]|nr:MAG: hypothetical protein EKI60_02470 [Candidatus Saccharibacteria bacterium]